MTGTSAAGDRITTPRNLINVGVFTAVYFVALFATGMLGAIHPTMIFIGGLLGSLINAMVCMLYVAKTRALGAYTLLGFIIGLLMVATGHAWVTPILSTVLGALADIITRSGGYVRTSTNCLGFAVFSMWGIGPMLPILWASDEYFAKTASSMGQDYADKFQALVSPPVIGGWLVLSLLVAYACALLGMKVLHRHFERAGVA